MNPSLDNKFLIASCHSIPYRPSYQVLSLQVHALMQSHLAAANYPSLCVLPLSLSMSLCMPVYVERE